MTDASDGNKATKQAKIKSRPKVSPSISALEKLSPSDLQTLRLDEQSQAEFAARVQRFSQSTVEFQALEGEDVGAMDDARYDQFTTAQSKLTGDATDLVHFLAPRILRLRDGAAKRQWRSFLTKFKKHENLK